MSVPKTTNKTNLGNIPDLNMKSVRIKALVRCKDNKTHLPVQISNLSFLTALFEAQAKCLVSSIGRAYLLTIVSIQVRILYKTPICPVGSRRVVSTKSRWNTRGESVTTQNGFARALMFNYQNCREFPKMTCRAKAIVLSLSYSGKNSILKIEYKVLTDTIQHKRLLMRVTYMVAKTRK